MATYPGYRHWNRMESERRPVHKEKLTSQQRQSVIDRARSGESPQTLALEFGITAAYVRLLRS